VHKFDVLGNEQPAPTTGDRAGDREDPDFKLMRSFGTAIPTSVAVFSPPNPPNPAPPTTKPSPNPPTPPSEPQGNVELVGNQDHQVDNNEVVASGSGNVSAGVMTDRDKLWLKEHNDRRQL
jgi:heme-binding NEAT domain protein